MFPFYSVHIRQKQIRYMNISFGLWLLSWPSFTQCPDIEGYFEDWPTPSNITVMVDLVNIIQVDPINFSDPIFKAIIVNNYDLNQDGEICWDEAQRVNTVYCAYSGVTDITGVAYFNNLTGLFCGNNQLTFIPGLKAQTLLEELDCNNNLLTTMPDISSLTNLVALHCYGNQLTKAPDVSNLSKLQWYTIHSNLLTSVPNVGMILSPELHTFWCYGNYFELDDCPDIQQVLAMELSDFIWNPQYDEFGTPYFLLCP